MRTALTSIVSGTLFGAGLALGGMTDPARVRGMIVVDEPTGRPGKSL